MLLLEVLSWQFDGKSGTFNWYANYATNMLFAWSTPMITCGWASYLDYQIYGSYDRLKSRWFYIQPIIMNTILIVVNLFRPLIFSVNTQNIYSRESGMWLIVLINSITFFYICYIAYKNRSNMNQEITTVLFLYVCMPVLAAGLQVILYGVFVLWPTMAITLVLTYIFLETISASKDYLTGLMTRHKMDNYLEYLLYKKKSFNIVMIDLNDFKMINDTYGHVKGDLCLKLFSKELSAVFKSAKLVSRYAGDEFVIIDENYSLFEIETYIKQLKNNLFTLSQTSEIEFLMTFSHGVFHNDPKDKNDYETVMHITDQNMYRNKKVMKTSCERTN